MGFCSFREKFIARHDPNRRRYPASGEHAGLPLREGTIALRRTKARRCRRYRDQRREQKGRFQVQEHLQGLRGRAKWAHRCGDLHRNPCRIRGYRDSTLAVIALQRRPARRSLLASSSALCCDLAVEARAVRTGTHNPPKCKSRSDCAPPRL